MLPAGIPRRCDTALTSRLTSQLPFIGEEVSNMGKDFMNSLLEFIKKRLVDIAACSSVLFVTDTIRIPR